MCAYYVADDARLVGDVRLGEEASVWYHSVLRGDQAEIVVGNGSNIQDNTVVHVSPGLPVTIGEHVSVGHGVILHGCTIKDRVLVGMGSIILNGAVIGEDSLVGAGTLVLENQIIPPRSLVVGSPARVIRQISETNHQDILYAAEEYILLSKEQLAACERDKDSV